MTSASRYAATEKFRGEFLYREVVRRFGARVRGLGMVWGIDVTIMGMSYLALDRLPGTWSGSQLADAMGVLL